MAYIGYTESLLLAKSKEYGKNGTIEASEHLNKYGVTLDDVELE